MQEIYQEWLRYMYGLLKYHEITNQGLIQEMYISWKPPLDLWTGVVNFYSLLYKFLDICDILPFVASELLQPLTH